MLALVFMSLIGISFTALGLSFASRMEDMQAFPLVMNFVILPLFFLSGAVFPIDRIPQVLKVIVYIDPLTYGVDAMRFGLVGVSSIPLWIDFAVAITVCILFTLIGTQLFKRIQM